MKNQNNLPVTEVMSPLRKIKVANHPLHGLFSLYLHFMLYAFPQFSLPYVCEFQQTWVGY